VAAGFVASGLLARALRAGTWIGATQLLLRLRLLPGYSGQRQLRARLSAAEYQAWRSAVIRSFRHGAAAELRAVPAAARAAGELLAAPPEEPTFADLPLAVVSSGAYGPRWEAWQQRWGDRSRWHVQHRTRDRFHDVHLRHPDLVVDAVREVLTEAAVRASATSRQPAS
jgi:hypothetical protein